MPPSREISQERGICTYMDIVKRQTDIFLKNIVFFRKFWGASIKPWLKLFVTWSPQLEFEHIWFGFLSLSLKSNWLIPESMHTATFFDLWWKHHIEDYANLHTQIRKRGHTMLSSKIIIQNISVNGQLTTLSFIWSYNY